MKVTGFYLLDPDYIELIHKLKGTYDDKKERPIYCCLQDEVNENIFWAVPTSDLSHRNKDQIKKYNKYCNLTNNDIRSCYYHLGHTNRPALFKISNALPVTEEYILREYISQGKHLVIKDKNEISEISRKLRRILFVEQNNPNHFEQHITDLYNYLTNHSFGTVSDSVTSQKNR